MATKKSEIFKTNDVFPDYDALIRRWTGDFNKMRTDIENTIHNLTTLTIEIKVDNKVSSQKTEIDLISGDVTITVSKEPTKDDLTKLQADALDLALKNLDKRIDALIKIVEVVCKAISPTGSFNDLFKTLANVIKPVQPST